MSLEIRGDKELAIMLEGHDGKLVVKADKGLRRFGFILLALLQARTPVDEGRLLGDWKPSHEVSPGAIASFKITNGMPYAGVIEKGSKIGELPWRNPGPLTMVANGRIFSKQAPGGMIGPILPAVLKDAAKEVWEELKNGPA